MKSRVVKRSIIVAGHKTSVSLEDAFWNALKEIAIARGTTISKVVSSIDAERQRGNLVIGQNASMRFIDGGVRNGTISFVSLSAEKATRTYTVEARIPNPDAAIADGVTCEMTVSLEPVEASAVPRSALVFSDDGLRDRGFDDVTRAAVSWMHYDDVT